MRGGISVVFVVTLLAVGATVVVSNTYHTSPNSSPATSAQQPSILSVFNPTTNLELAMLLNASTVKQGQTLTVSLNLYNTLGTINNVTGEEDWLLANQSENSGAVGWNCAQNDIFRIEVVGGYYDLNNFSKGAPLDAFVWQPPFASNECAYYVRAANETAEPISIPWQGQNNYAFSPRSNVAWWTTTQDWSIRCGPANTTISYPCPQVGQKAVMNETMILETALFANSTGVFTVICGDEWGDLEVSHFYVSPNAGGLPVLTESLTNSATMSGPTYSDNGLTCPLSSGNVLANVDNDSRISSVIQQVVQTPEFLSAANGSAYALAYAGIDITGLFENASTTIYKPPNVLELVFVTDDSHTSCVNPVWIDSIGVQIPIINNTYAVGQETVLKTGGPK